MKSLQNRNNHLRQSMVILRKLQDFNDARETGYFRRSPHPRTTEQTMVAFGQEIESLMHGTLPGVGKDGSPSPAPRSPQKPGGKPSGKPVQPVSLSFELGADARNEADKTVAIPRVSFKKRSISKAPGGRNDGSHPNQDADSEYNFIEMRPLAGIKNAADRVREQERAQMDPCRSSEFTVKNDSAGDAASPETRSVPQEYLSSLRASAGSKSTYAYRNVQQTNAGEPAWDRTKLKKVGKMRTIEIVGKQGQAIHLPNEAGSPLASVYQSKDERSESDAHQLPTIQAQGESAYRRLQKGSPGRQGYGRSLQDLQIVGSKKNAIPLIQRGQQAKAGKKNRQYFHETIPAPNEDIRSYTNQEESRNPTAALAHGPRCTHSSMAVEPSDAMQAHTVQGRVHSELRDGPDKAGSYLSFPPQYLQSRSALSDYLGEDHLPVPSRKRAKVMTQPYMYSTAKEPAPARIAEQERSDETESEGRAIALEPKPISKSPFLQAALQTAHHLGDAARGPSSMNVAGNQVANPIQKNSSAHLTSAEPQSMSSSHFLQAGSPPSHVQAKVKMMEAKNRLRATHILPNARLKDMKKMSMTEMRKGQFGAEYAHQTHVQRAADQERKRFLLLGTSSQSYSRLAAHLERQLSEKSSGREPEQEKGLSLDARRDHSHTYYGEASGRQNTASLRESNAFANLGGAGAGTV